MRLKINELELLQQQKVKSCFSQLIKICCVLFLYFLKTVTSNFKILFCALVSRQFAVNTKVQSYFKIISKLAVAKANITLFLRGYFLGKSSESLFKLLGLTKENCMVMSEN